MAFSFFVHPAPQSDSTTESSECDGSNIDFQAFADIKRVDIDNSSDKPFSIGYSENHYQIMAIFRGVLETQEKSPRTIALTSAVISENPSDLTGWWFRQLVLDELGFEPLVELRFVDKIMQFGLKSYQAWRHRKWVLERMEKPPSDLQYLIDRIQEDVRNFHAWSYLIWFAKHFDICNEILEITMNFINKDKRNGSAWNARSTIIKETNYDINAELKLVFEKLTIEGSNEACCNYIRFLLTEKNDIIELVISMLQDFIKKNKAPSKSCIILLLQCYEKINDKRNRELLCKSLIQIDPLRKRYWTLVMKGDENYV